MYNVLIPKTLIIIYAPDCHKSEKCNIKAMFAFSIHQSNPSVPTLYLDQPQGFAKNPVVSRDQKSVVNPTSDNHITTF